MEQAVTFAVVAQWGRVQSPVGRSFQGEVSSGFSSPVRQMSQGRFRPTRSPQYHLAVNGCVNDVYRLSCSCCLGDGPGIGLIPHPGRPPCPCVVKKVCRPCDPNLISSPDRSWLCKARVAWVTTKFTYKGEVKLRQWMIILYFLYLWCRIGSRQIIKL